MEQDKQQVDGHQANIGEMKGDIGHVGDNIQTGGGSYVEGSVQTGGGDFVGRDKIVNVYQQDRAEAEIPPLPYEPETVLVPSGPFLMGDADVAGAAPQHTVDLPAFRIGRYPVTNEQFAHFIWKTNRVAGSELLWAGNRPPAGEEQLPAAGVTWYEALAYCEWLAAQTGRPYTLPGEAQWEKAARGSDGRRFPWGDQWDPTCCHARPGRFAAVDAYPPQSPYGVCDLVGNAREWTATLWGSESRLPDARYRYPWAADGREQLDAPPTTRRVYRGGRGDAPEDYACSARGSYLPERPGPRRHRHGFRVLLPLPAAGQRGRGAR